MARKSRRSFASKILPDFSDPAKRGRFVRRAGLCVVTATVAWTAAVSAIVGVKRVNQPQLAAQLSPNDPRALVELAVQKIQKGEVKAAEAMLQRAIAGQPLLPKAFGVLAAAAYSDGRDARAARLMAQSRQLSRRDAVTSKLYVRRTADQGDIPGLLENYDIALRTNVELNQQLAPQLAAALDVAEFKPYFQEIVRRRPPWLGQVVMIALSTTKKPSQLAEILMSAGPLPDASIQKTAESTLLAKIAEAEDWAMLRRYYLSLRGATPAMLTDPGFTAKSIDPAHNPVSWALVSDASVEAGFMGDKAKSSLKGVAFRDTRGIFARKTLLLAPARYTLSITASGFADRGNAQAWASLFCYTSAGRQSLLTLPISSGNRDVSFEVSQDCLAQSLELGLAGGDNQAGAEISVDRVTLTRS